MTLQRTIICITSVFIAIGIAASQASAQAQECGLTIEINALRGGSPTVTVERMKDITAKARIMKGTALKETTIETELEIVALDGADIVNRKTSFPIVLGVGKGGKGDTLALNIEKCDTGSIEFVATFSGTDDDGNPCEVTRSITKTCK